MKPNKRNDRIFKLTMRIYKKFDAEFEKASLVDIMGNFPLFHKRCKVLTRILNKQLCRLEHWPKRNDNTTCLWRFKDTNEVYKTSGREISSMGEINEETISMDSYLETIGPECAYGELLGELFHSSDKWNRGRLCSFVHLLNATHKNLIKRNRKGRSAA